MKVKYQDKIEQIDALWKNGFRGTGPKGRIILSDDAALKSELNKPSSTSSSTSTSSSIEYNTSSFELDQIMTKVDFKILKRDLALVSNKSVPH